MNKLMMNIGLTVGVFMGLFVIYCLVVVISVIMVF